MTNLNKYNYKMHNILYILYYYYNILILLKNQSNFNIYYIILYLDNLSCIALGIFSNLLYLLPIFV